MILLNNQQDKINTSGDCWQYLGIGYCRDYQKNLSEFKNSGEIGYASGTATLMRADLLKKYGLWSNDFFLYHEDVDYSLRLRSLGYKIVLAEKSIFYHDYEFGRNKKKYFWLERNRYAIKLIYYKIPTLVLLLPLEILYNFGLIFFAFFSGWFLDLLRVYVYWLQPKNWTTWLVLRKKIQTGRVIKDKDLLRQAVNTVNTEQIGSKFILLPANIVFAVYGFLLRLVVWW
jgi:GT2 family glycosyltransferase